MKPFSLEPLATPNESTPIAQKINSTPVEELRDKFSNAQLFEMLNSIPTSFGDGQIPEDDLDAEAKIYSTYQPSEALQELHKDANLSAIGAYEPKELFIAREGWKTKVDIEKKVIFIKEYVEKLSEKYALGQEIQIALYDEPFDESGSAMWMPTHEPDKIGVLILYKSVIEKSDLPTILSAVSHEVAHGYQEFIEKEIADIPEGLRNDQEWFKAYRARHRERTKYVEAYKASNLRYRATPVEQDAWGMQLSAYNELNGVSDQYADSILMEAGMDTYTNIKNQSVVARWVARNLKEDTTTDDLIREAEKVAQNFPDTGARIIDFVSGKNKGEILDAIKAVEENRMKADKLLGLNDL